MSWVYESTRVLRVNNQYGSTGWGDAVAIVPWQLYLHYGDTAILAEALPAMVRWVDFVRKHRAAFAY